ncbi:glyoxalase/bleomycin resistance/extradiol dioxygenase family protein [Paenibacillus larvae]|uniref:VOC family protein n=4 Tax=Paenibacillus larvae TaxID=1464 RepID=A0A1V0UUV0_9BACL|nr:glyoxalase/bleomycin resistance/extradiol dioxygenase family protein [Paenibacillus larvae]AHD04493.1 putative transcriptional regulator [Paenibacillus larvae subsp. larvae DSM 25430]AQR79293.1 VOC family protein [Paenibacillus larvae subsp. larvae]ARF69015.1 VOC family protein [Paenibacillus larvae subsp. pulvifaciens]ETK29861.1 putative transcriptional regulator [Paenibacillus larvae subsp. larvae DSM 25719]MCY7476871.1 glyoxalase/bleomycin resistance/extradiol dioxygenase family protein 
MAKLSPYFAFENAKEAMSYYEKVFGATHLARIPVGKEMAKQFNIPENQIEHSTMHGSFSIEGNLILCSYSFGRKITPNEFVSMLIDFNSEDSEDEQKMIDLYNRVVESGEVNVTMPLQKQFWGGKMGTFTDKYDITWMLHSQPYSKM